MYFSVSSVHKRIGKLVKNLLQWLAIRACICTNVYQRLGKTDDKHSHFWQWGYRPEATRQPDTIAGSLANRKDFEEKTVGWKKTNSVIAFEETSLVSVLKRRLCMSIWWMGKPSPWSAVQIKDSIGYQCSNLSGRSASHLFSSLECCACQEVWRSWQLRFPCFLVNTWLQQCYGPCHGRKFECFLGEVLEMCPKGITTVSPYLVFFSANGFGLCFPCFFFFFCRPRDISFMHNTVITYWHDLSKLGNFHGKPNWKRS